MKKLSILLIATIFSVASAFAQDIITLKNGEDIKALVQEIGEIDVKYKKFDNSNGPNYTLKKSEILIIRYANGTKDIFSEEEKPVEKQDVSISESVSVKNDDNPSTNTNFVLKKKHEIMIDPYVRLNSNTMYQSLEMKLKTLGFCCVYKHIDEQEATPDIVIIVSFAGTSAFRFHILDKASNRNVFEKKYVYWTTINKVVENFIKDIIPFIEK